MNANELADELENGSQKAEDHATIAKRVKKAATMLRQQQAEIESFKRSFELALFTVKKQHNQIEEILKRANEK
jgi:hypothetical protein